MLLLLPLLSWGSFARGAPRGRRAMEVLNPVFMDETDVDALGERGTPPPGSYPDSISARDGDDGAQVSAEGGFLFLRTGAPGQDAFVLTRCVQRACAARARPGPNVVNV